ncbi:MAG: hypothetical protein QM485_02985 [Flavobacteriaceae bacterium]
MKHQLEYASAGSNQVTISTNNGIQARFVKDPKGNIYLLIDNVVYPIASELVAEAKTIDELVLN